MNKIMELVGKAYETHIAWGQDSATLGDVDDATQAVEAEVSRMVAELADAVEGEIRALDSLKAAMDKLTALEAQEPVSAEYQNHAGIWCGFINEKHRIDTTKDGTWPIRMLYLTAGAKP